MNQQVVCKHTTGWQTREKLSMYLLIDVVKDLVQKNRSGNWPSTCSFKLKCINSRTLDESVEKIGIKRYFHTSKSSTLNAEFDASKSSSASGGEGQPAWPAQSPDTLIEAWFYTVAPRGNIHLNLPFKTIVRSLNPQVYPDMNKVIMEIHLDASSADEIQLKHDFSLIEDLSKIDVGFDQDQAKMNVTSHIPSGVTLPVVCMLWIPLQTDLTATVQSDKDLTVEKLEGNDMNLSTQQGNCYLKSLKCGSVNVQSCAGNIISRSTVLGNINFQVGKSGGIQADKLQGSNVVCQTEMGGVAVKSLYADMTTVHTTGGTVQLGQCHGQMILQGGHSHVRIGSLEGDIDLGLVSGSVNIHLSNHSNSNIDVKDGDIHISFPDGTSTDLNLDCHTVHFGNNVPMEFVNTDIPNHLEGHLGRKGKALVHARTLSGSINVSLLDWIHSTNLAFEQDWS
ncbi:family with sequence similarity 185, member A [Elysia marginata]|uniref:Family with sequence similarity 185, member A n=1 Tax=Elysia marginata TaxID=1093978 RepID=A0AAV4IWB9_9GAST|nr:family with sequence similarity 185, member A [Elysia marginata]